MVRPIQSVIGLNVAAIPKSQCFNSEAMNVQVLPDNPQTHKKVYRITTQIGHITREQSNQTDVNPKSFREARTITIKLEAPTPFAALAMLETFGRALVYKNDADFKKFVESYQHRPLYIYLEDTKEHEELRTDPKGDVAGRLYYHDLVDGLKLGGETLMGKDLIQKLNIISKDEIYATAKKREKALKIRLALSDGSDS